ncbi:MAG: zinc metallopeptidase [Bacillota bacterium]
MWFLYDFWGILFVLPGLILGIYAQSKVKTTFQKYSRKGNRNGISGEMVARELLAKKNIYGVSITQIGGTLTDHYNPSTDVVALSQGVYNSTSLAAVGVAAHECGHVEQAKSGYFMLKVRNRLVPVVNFTSKVFPIIMFAGIFFGIGGIYSTMYINAGLVFYGAMMIFSLVTLPVEFNASKRAYVNLQSCGILTKEEADGAKKVLDAAALTYMASFVTSMLWFLRFLMLANRD